MPHKKTSVRPYDEDFNDHYEEPLPEEEESDTTVPPPKTPSFLRSHLLTVTQITLCLLVLGFALISKSIGGTFFASVATWYFEHYNNSVFTGTGEWTSFFHEETQVSETSHLSADHHTVNRFVLPLKNGTVTSPYGQRTMDDGTEQFHKGVDIAADKNTEIAAVWDGTVLTAENIPSYGNYIVLQHDNGYTTLYAHCEKLLVQPDDIVTAGSTIALVGETGDADGCHLHLEIRKDGQHTDPSAFLKDAYT